MGTKKAADPNCRECDGTGVVETIDWVDYGSTTVQLIQHWDCDCVEEVEEEDENE